MLFNKRTILFWAAIVLAVFCLLSLVLARHANHRSLHIETDASLLTFELNSQTYTVRDKSLTISLKPGVYRYRAVSMVGDKRVVLADTADLTRTRSADLNFNFSIYGNQALEKAICKSLSPDSDNCPLKFTITKTVFAESYQWAVVLINSPDVGTATTVLQVDNGDWKVVDGPSTDIKTGGYFPQSVERIIENAQ